MNGREVGKFADGFDNEVQINPYDLKYGDWNYLTVRLEDSGGRWNWRGIKGDVFLESKPKTRAEFPTVKTFLDEGKIVFLNFPQNPAAEETAIAKNPANRRRTHGVQ